MECPKCGVIEQSQVLESRHAGIFQRRRRVCGKCSTRFTTYEVLATRLEEVEKVFSTFEVYKLREFLTALEGLQDLVSSMAGNEEDPPQLLSEFKNGIRKLKKESA